MAKITIKGDTSGEVDIVAPAVAGTTTYNLSTAGGDILASGDIGTTVQGYDADTAKYDDVTANFTGTLQVSGTAVVKAGDNISTLTNDSGYITGNQTITLSGDASGSGTTNIAVTVADDSHNHIISNVDGLQTALDAKAPLSNPTFTGNITVNGDILADELRVRTNQDLTITCGESFTAMTDATYNDEFIRLAGEQGVKVFASSDNLTSGLNRETTLIDTSGNMSLAGNLIVSGAGTLRDVTGDYGSIEVDGGATGGWEGYSIGGQSVFMTNGSVSGIYNDVNNQWILYGTHNGSTELRHAGSTKLNTTSGGINVSGNVTATSFSGDGSGLTGVSSYSDSDALSLFNASGNAPVYACRAWVSFNGGTSPSAGTIQGSGNVSSVTDNATGQATINFTSTMPNADYAVAGICTGYSNYNSSLMVLGSANGSGNQQPTTKTTSAVRVHYGHSNTVVNTDIGYMTVAIFG